MSKNLFTARTALAVVIANMIGTGVFTSLGFQLADIQSPFVLLSLWFTGGVIAVCGALSYAELGAALPRSGGEYHFLGRVYHPVIGFTSGWVSATVGFAAPVALAAMTFSAYLSASVPALAGGSTRKALAVALVAMLAVLHSGTRRSSGVTQGVFTIIKIAVIVGFCVLALLLVPEPQSLDLIPGKADFAAFGSGAFAVSLIYVSYAYTGWNAATYFLGEIERPQRELPRVLMAGTLVVTVLYVALNYVFLAVAPIAELTGELEVGSIAALHAFGPAGGQLAGLVLSLLLISTVSAMTLAGPRVLQVIGQDFLPFRKLALTNASGVPHVAIAFQSLLAVAMIVSASFESVLLFAGFILGLNSFATVLGVVILRRREPELARPFRVPFYPWVPLAFLALSGYSLVFLVSERPAEALAAAAVIAAGIIAYTLSRRLDGTP